MGRRIFPVLFLVLLGLVGATTTASSSTILSSSLPCPISPSPPATEKSLVESSLVESRRVARVLLDQLLKHLQQDGCANSSSIAPHKLQQAGTPLFGPAGACAQCGLDHADVSAGVVSAVDQAVDADSAEKRDHRTASNTIIYERGMIQRHLRALCEDIQQNPQSCWEWDDQQNPSSCWGDEDEEVPAAALPWPSRRRTAPAFQGGDSSSIFHISRGGGLVRIECVQVGLGAL